MRRALFQVHLWTGLALGLYITVSSLTGAVLVFHDELGRAAQARLHHVAPAELAGGGRRLTLDEAAAALQAALPDARILSLSPPHTPDGTFEAGILAGGYRLAFVHPASGDVTGPVAPGGAVLSWMHEVHANLLSGRRGRVLNGIGGLLLTLLAITGLFIWWPRSGQWRRVLLLKTGVGWKRANYDLHHVAGFWLLVPIVVLAATGAFFTWPTQYRAVIGWFSPIHTVPLPASDLSARAAGRATLEGAMDVARRAAPGARVIRIGIPGAPAQPYTVFMADEPSPRSAALTRAFVDQYTGRLLEVRRPAAARTAGEAIAGWLGPLHTGNVGVPALKVVWALAGLAPALLFTSGFLMWWHRVVQPRRRGAHARGVRAGTR